MLEEQIHGVLVILLTPWMDVCLQAIYAMGWEEDGRNKQAAIAERLIMLCQTAAKQYQGNHRDDVNAHQPLYIFESAMVHLSRITRVLSMEQGHLVLLGPAACGKRSLARLAAYMCGCTVVDAKLKDTQKGFSWRDTIKTALLAAGVQGRCELLTACSPTADFSTQPCTSLPAPTYPSTRFGAFHSKADPTLV